MERERGTILLCTLGASWAVVPEVFGVVAPRILDLFRDHPRRAKFAEELARRGIHEPTQVWVATSGGTERGLGALVECWRAIPCAPPMRIWVAENTQNLATAEECEELRELLFRLVFHATERVGPESLLLSLAGGRKTMSADLQWAGSVFGARVCLHVIDHPPLPDKLRNPEPQLLAAPLPQELAGALEPVFLGPFERSDLLDVPSDAFAPLRAEDFPIGDEEVTPANDLVTVIRWKPESPANAAPLVSAWLKREKDRARVYVSHLKSLLEQESRANWYGLYRLPPKHIEALRTRTVDTSLRTWLLSLPKADLHCHLGGVLDLAEQKAVGQAVWDSLIERERNQALEAVAPLLRERSWPSTWPQHLGHGRERTARAAALLVHLSLEELQHRLFDLTEPRVALRERHELGFRAYELPGELSGSALLQRESGVREYALQAYRRLRRDGLRYCELRGSPHKYLAGDAFRFLHVFENAVRQAQREDPGLELRFLVVLDRRRPLTEESIRFIVEARRSFPEFVVGVDVAGDEQDSPRFEELAARMDPVFEQCLPLTIHAGEGEPADNIWKAVYRLHAERVGHGLTLHERRDLACRLRDRGIAIELCPTSNIEVVGYYDPGCVETEDLGREYPLQSYLRDLQLDVVICTDNPGISRTNLTEEYLRAARMCGVLTLWQLLSLVRASFEHAFLPADQRAALLRECDARVVELVTRLLEEQHS